MMMPESIYSSGNDYRYSINGQEKSPEIAPNTTTAKFWEYDSRISRRWNVDPKPTIGISDYSTFANNPIIKIDILGDSVVDPKRTVGNKVYVLNKTRDLGSKLSFSRYKKAQEKDPTHTILIETDKLDKTTVADIVAKLGKDGYIQTLALDFHRSVYDDMPASDKNAFFSGLANGYAGQQTQAFLGMCWAGGGPRFNNTDHIDLTFGISKALDKATVYGLKTEANNMAFWYNGDFGGFVNPAYAIGNDNVSKSERKYESTWTISTYSTKLKAYTSTQVKETIKFTIEGTINRTPFVSGLDRLMNPKKDQYGIYH